MPRITQSSPTDLSTVIAQLLQNQAPSLVLGIGIPGSGKSTILKALAANLNIGYVCPDDIRAELFGDARDQSRNAEAWAEAYRRMKECIATGQSAIIDATSIKPNDRQMAADQAREAGARQVIGVHVFAPLDTVLRRNASRSRQVPEAAIHKLSALLAADPPGGAQCLDWLIEVDNGPKTIK